MTIKRAIRTAIGVCAVVAPFALIGCDDASKPATTTTPPANNSPAPAKPDMAKPDMAKPDMAKPDMAKPDAAKKP